MLLVLETDNRVPYYFLCLSQLAVLWNLLEPSDELDCSQSQQEAPDAADAPWDSWEGLPLTKDLKEATPAGFVQTWWVGTVSRDRGPSLWPSWRGGCLSPAHGYDGCICTSGVSPTHNLRALGQHHAAFEKVSEKQPLALSDLPLTGEATMSV